VFVCLVDFIAIVFTSYDFIFYILFFFFDRRELTVDSESVPSRSVYVSDILHNIIVVC